MKITFSSVEEFLEELHEDRGQVEDGILRLTTIYRQQAQLPLVQITVWAGCIIRGKLVELRHYIGDTFTQPEPDDKVRVKAQAIRHKIVSRVMELDLDVRNGMFQ